MSQSIRSWSWNAVLAVLLGFFLAAPATGQTPDAVVETQALRVSRAQVTLKNGTKISTQVYQGKSVAPVYVLLNGLIYETHRWYNVSERLAQTGATVINFAYSPQPENLRLLEANETPKFFARGLELKDLASDVDEILTQLGVSTKVHVVGLSYGASVAAEFSARFAGRVEQTIFVSPLVIPTDYYDNGGRSLRAWLNTVRFWENTPCDLYGAVNPWLCSSQDYWYNTYYNSLYEQYLAKRIQNIPAGIEADLYKKSVFHLVRAARDFDLRNSIQRLKNVHMFVASDDDAPLRQDQERAWDEADATQKRSYVLFRGAHHALPDEAPQQLSKLLKLIGEKDSRMMKGERMEVSAY